MLNIGEIIQTIKSMVETKIELIKLDIQEEFSGIVSRFVILIMVGAISLLGLLFLSLSSAFYLNQVMESSFAGFLALGVFYLFLILVLILSKDSKSFQQQIQKSIKGFLFPVAPKKQNNDE